MKNHPKIVTDSHRQKFRGSCATSLCELLLKLEAEVPPDLQQHETSQSTGLAHIKDKTYGTVTLRQFDRSERNSEFVKKELTAGRAVGLFILNHFFKEFEPDVHGWAVTALVECEGEECVHLLSKSSEFGNGEGRQTLEEFVPLDLLDGRHVTDIVHYEVATSG